MDIQSRYKKEFKKPITSRYGKHPRLHYVNWLESKLAEVEKDNERLRNKWENHESWCEFPGQICDCKGG